MAEVVLKVVEVVLKGIFRKPRRVVPGGVRASRYPRFTRLLFYQPRQISAFLDQLTLPSLRPHPRTKTNFVWSRLY